VIIPAETYRPPTKIFKSAILLSPDGTIPIPYHKQSLVPFTEYIPMKGLGLWPEALFSKLSKTPTTGEKPVLYPISPGIGVKEVQVSPMICYDDIDPEVARAAVRAGSNLLVDLTAGTWTSSSLPLRQHFLAAAFRSIENRRAMVRSAATGVSALVDPAGRTVETAPFEKETTLQAELPILSKKTVYTAYVGEDPWWILSVFCCLFAGVKVVRTVTSKRKPEGGRVRVDQQEALRL
jgi:apolipoprotein N-acyltransferase